MMTLNEERERRALLHEQAAQLLRAEADRHDADARSLREEVES